MERLALRPMEAAEAIGISRSAVYALISAGELPAIRVGGVLRVPCAELREWIASKSREVKGFAPEPVEEQRPHPV